MSHREARKLDAYTETILELSPDLVVDLRAPLDDDARQAIAALGIGPRFAVMTAENPHGDHEEDAGEADEDDRRHANRRRSSRLAGELARAGRRLRWVETRSPDGEHRERCAAFAAELDEARALAARFDQLAFFYFDGHRFLLCPGEIAAPTRTLPPP